jgi:gluconokinase
MIILLMGVTGAGKTTVGRALAQELGWTSADADDYHSAANVAKMHAGIPLTDKDRGPWLQALHNAIQSWIASDDNVVLACSALKASYRDTLIISSEVKLVYLRAAPAPITARLAARPGHYMNPQLISSQFETLEEPGDALTVDASASVQEIVHQIRTGLCI